MDQDLACWPLAPAVISQVVRLRLLKGHEALLKQCKELLVRAAVVRMVAFTYIAHHLEDLKTKRAAQTIRRTIHSATLQESEATWA